MAVTRTTVSLPHNFTYTKEKEMGRLTLASAKRELESFASELQSFGRMNEYITQFPDTPVSHLIFHFFGNIKYQVTHYSKLKRTYSFSRFVITEEGEVKAAKPIDEPLPKMSFAEFKASKVEMTRDEFEKKYGAFLWDDCQPTLSVYADRGLYIENMPDGKYYLLIDRSDYVSENITELEELLYEWADGECIEATQEDRERLAKNFIELKSVGSRMIDFGGHIYIHKIPFERVPKQIFKRMSEEDKDLVWNTFKIDCR
jgi:hypothetical protein